ncbi:MAG: hypothetical protein AAGA29_02975 [Planctomycetota bacterium]
MTASPTSAMHADTPADAFPGDDALCEDCGYPIKGIHPAGHCPECGSAVADSHPDRRNGPAFDQRPGPIGYVQTAFAVLRHPKRTFRAMRVDGLRQPCRRYLLISALLAAMLWAFFYIALYQHTHRLPNYFALENSGYRLLVNKALIGIPLVSGCIVILTYIEVLGVAWFSRRRGWRVPLPVAERIACYASVGWLPGAAVLGFAMHALRDFSLQKLMREYLGNVASGAGANYANDAAWVIVFFVGVLAMLGFETLVWVGVRQVKFANTPAPAPPDPIAPAAHTAGQHHSPQ